MNQVEMQGYTRFTFSKGDGSPFLFLVFLRLGQTLKKSVQMTKYLPRSRTQSLVKNFLKFWLPLI
jgi:hypothetical protein